MRGLQFSSAHILYLHVTLISLWQATHEHFEKKYGKCGIFLGENMGQILDFWGHFEKDMGQLWDILKNFK